MEEQLQQALAKILGMATDGVQAGVTLLQAQLPDVIQQLLVWKLTISAIGFALGVGMLVAAAFCAVYADRTGQFDARAKAQREKDRAYRAYMGCSVRSADWDRVKEAYHTAQVAYEAVGEPQPNSVVALVAAFVLALASVIPLNLTWLQIWLAPKIYLIEYAASLAK